METKTDVMMNLAKRSITIAIAIALCMTVCAGTAFAYFTSNAKASGGHTIALEYSSNTNETIVDGNKQISMQNTGSADIMVRIQLFFGTGVNNNIAVETPGADGWSKTGITGSEVWTYSKVLAAGESTSILPVNVSAAEDVDLSNFDVVVIGQTSPVYYDEAGVPVPYLWTSADPNTQE